MNRFQFAKFIAWRYLRTRRSEAFINFISIFSVLGVALGVAVLLISMAIMGGFERELRSKLVGSAHIIVTNQFKSLENWTAIKDEIKKESDVQAVSAFTENPGLISFNGKVQGVLVKGVESGSKLESELAKYLQNPSEISNLHKEFQAKQINLPAMIIGKELASNLFLTKQTPVSLMSSQVTSSPLGLMPRSKRFLIADTFTSGLSGYESGLVYTSLEQSQNFFRMDGAISAFEIQVKSPDKVAKIRSALEASLQTTFGKQMIVSDWTIQNKELWEAVKLEKRVYFIVLLLLIALGSFSIVSTLIMLVLEKKKDIAVLRSLGASASLIALIFRLQGLIIGVAGTILGLLFGYLGSIALREYGFPLPENVFPTSVVPVEIELASYLIVGIATFIICFLSTIYPALRASRMQPVEILRYE